MPRVFSRVEVRALCRKLEFIHPKIIKTMFFKKLAQLSPLNKASSIKAWINQFGTRTEKDLPKNVATAIGCNGPKISYCML